MKDFHREILGLRRLFLDRRHHRRAVSEHIRAGAFFDAVGRDGNAAGETHDVRMTGVHSAVDHRDAHSPAGA
jgi:hypothetical protein